MYYCFSANQKGNYKKKKRMAMIRLQKYHTKQSLSIAIDLCQAHYQIFLIFYLKDFIVISAQIVNHVLITFQSEINQFIFRCFDCKKNYKKDFNKELINRFSNTYKFCNEDINKFILLLRKGVYLYECMDSWERFDETLLPDKEAFYSSLNMVDVTDVHYRHAKREFKNLSNKNLGDYHDLHVRSDTLLLADVFENFRNMCIKVCELDPAVF